MSSETEPRNEVNLIQEVLEPLCKATSRHEAYSQSWKRVLSGRSGILFKGKKRFHFQFHCEMLLQSVSEYYLYGDGELRRRERDRRPGMQKALYVFSGLPMLSPSCYITSASLTVKPAVNGSGTMGMYA